METKDNHKIDDSKPKSNNHRKIIGIIIIIVLALWMIDIVINDMINNTEVPNEKPDCYGECRRSVSAKTNIESIWNNDRKISFIIKSTGTYTYSKEDVSYFQIYINGIPYDNLLSDCLERLREPGSICQIDTDIDFPSKTGEEGRVDIKVNPPFGLVEVYSCIIESTSANTC